MTAATLTYAEIADQLGEVAAATDIDIYGHQVVVYRDHGTSAPFKATVISPVGEIVSGHNEYPRPVDLGRHLVNLDDGAIVQPDLVSLRDACAAQGLAFPVSLLPVVTLIERERELRAEGHVRLRVRRTEENGDGTKTMVVEGEAALVDAAWETLAQSIERAREAGLTA